eukprot:m.222545 g.222545  ORF g.222545 m.222545 type:complete len:173 (-) comp16053_c0_seq1:216-734(-)
MERAKPFVPNPVTQPFAIGSVAKEEYDRSLYNAPKAGDYPAHVRAPTERKNAPFALENDVPTSFQTKVKGICAPRDGGVPFAVEENVESFATTSSSAFVSKGVVYKGQAKAKVGDSQGGIPYATEHTVVAPTAAPSGERERVPWALASDPAQAAAPVTKRGMAPKGGNTQPW